MTRSSPPLSHTLLPICALPRGSSHSNFLTTAWFRALLAVPVRIEERAQGLLYAMRFSITSFSPSSIQVAMLYSGQISAALENAKLYRALSNELAERVRAEQQRKRLEAKLGQAQRMEAIGTFAGGIAHDFNNLLGAIIGNIELAQLDLDDNAMSFRLLEEAFKAATQAADLTRKFITFSAGGHPVKVITAANSLITDAVSLSLSGSNVKVEYGLPDDLWEVEVDQEQMKQALSSIIVNAREAMPGGGTIRVTAENIEMCPLTDTPDTTDEKARFVEVVIADQGMGIPPENLEKIFDPYFSTKQRGSDKGMGIGLSIALSIINKHRGCIRVKSQLGIGTAFHVCLPACQARNLEEAAPFAGRSTHPGIKVRLLLMEDEAVVAEMTIHMLHHLGYEDVEHARDGAEAVERFTRAQESGVPFDLVILDLTVKGGIGGKETIKRLKDINPSIRAIVISGYSSDPVMSDYANYGFCGSLRKPYGMRDLRAALEAAIGHEQHQDRVDRHRFLIRYPLQNTFYLMTPAAAWAICPSWVDVPPDTPMAPIILSFCITGTPPSTALIPSRVKNAVFPPPMTVSKALVARLKAVAHLALCMATSRLPH